MDFDPAMADRRRSASSNIYHCLYNAKDFCSRQSLARELNISLPTVYQNLAKLMAAGLIRDSGEQQSTGGRKASGLSIVPDARIAAGVSVTENRLRLVAADLPLNEQIGRASCRERVSDVCSSDLNPYPACGPAFRYGRLIVPGTGTISG